MNKMSVCLFLIILSTIALHAQVDHYEGKNTLNCGNFNFRVETFNDYYVIYNTNNQNLLNPFNLYALENWYNFQQEVHETVAKMRDNPKIIRAMREVFSEDEIQAFKESNEKIALGFMYDNDGIVHEVSFGFPKEPIFYSIPPEKWYSWEQKIKEYLIFPTPYEVPENIRYWGEYFYLWEIE